MPQTSSAKVIKKENLAKDFWLVTFEFENDYPFLAGQYVSLKVAADGTRRSYSIASAPNGKRLQLMVDVGPMGVGSKYILGLEVGDNVEVLGPLGRFILGEATKNVLFVATGSGIVPFRPMIRELLEKRSFTDEIHLDWGMRYEEDLFWTDEFKKLETDHANFKFDVVLSKPTKEWSACSGHVNDCLVKHKASYLGWEAYLCGSQQMIGEVAALLSGLGVAKEDIHFEKFF